MDLSGDVHKSDCHSHSQENTQHSRMASSAEGSGARTALLMGCLPIVANLFSSSFRTWSEFAMLVLVMIWVMYILEAPWKAFYNCRRMRYSKRDRLLVVMIFASPWVAAYSLYTAKHYFGDLTPGNNNGPLREFSIPLFLLAALVRPMAWFLRDGKDLGLGTRVREVLPEIKQYRHLLGQVLDRLDRLEEALPQGLSTPTGENEARGTGHLPLSESGESRPFEGSLLKKIAVTNREYEQRISELELQVLALSRKRYEPPESTSVISLASRLVKEVFLRVAFILFFPWFFARSVARKTLSHF